ncbi:MAG: lipB [Alphaproteobacteria bacterium]|nr:lipB [Alphaproteobacteria bacterium]
MIEWIKTPGLVKYEEAVAEMEKRVAAIRAGTAPEAVWLLEHPPLYTAGTSAKAADLLAPRFPVHQTGRGGQYTYHGPGQRIAYVMLNLAARGGDIRRYVWQLEDWVIQSLAALGIRGERREGRIGIWVGQGSSENKIAAIGVRVRGGVTYHGVSINVYPDLSHYAGIIPCGINAFGVTSLADMGNHAGMEKLDTALQENFNRILQ